MRSESPLNRPRSPNPATKADFCKILTELVDKQTDDRSFREMCDVTFTILKERNSDPSDEGREAYKLWEILPILLHQNAKPPSSETRYRGLLQLLEVFGDNAGWRHAQGDEVLVALIKEFLTLLSEGRDALGRDRLGDINMSCVKCLTSLPPRTAYWALLAVLKENERLVSLVIKCLKKVDKSSAKDKNGCSEEKQERYGKGLMEVVLSSRDSVLKLNGPLRRQAWVEGAKEVVEIARRWLPEVVDECILAACDAASGIEDRKLIEEIYGKSLTSVTESPRVLIKGEENSSKENMPNATVEITTKHVEPLVASIQSTVSPCMTRNVLG